MYGSCSAADGPQLLMTDPSGVSWVSDDVIYLSHYTVGHSDYYVVYDLSHLDTDIYVPSLAILIYVPSLAILIYMCPLSLY